MMSEENGQKLTVLEDKGNGQPLIIVFEKDSPTELPFYLLDNPLEESRTIAISIDKVEQSGCQELTEQLLKYLDDNSIRQGSFIGFGDAGSVVQNLAIAHQRRVRRIILVDSPTRPHLTLIEKLINRVEKALPLGLPFRGVGAAFDSRSFLQRIRCPSLVITTSKATPFISGQAEILSSYMATAWFKKIGGEIKGESEGAQMKGILTEFYTIPAKRPQKQRKQAVAIGNAA